MEAFLSRVAHTYLSKEKEQLIDYCFVFPNKRSGMFFSKYLTENATQPILLPKIATISELVNDFSTGIEASRFEQLFILYNEYKSLSSDISEFDQFQFWGDMLLNDFNDVDKYLVDAQQLFKNIKELKQINSNYLTHEQIEIINKYWGENRPLETIKHFWAHVNKESDSQYATGHFLKLWEILHELYTNFRATLNHAGMSYQGMAYRNAAEILKCTSIEELPYKRYIFIGFNVLSNSELAIFNRFSQMGCADFYWDFNSPTFNGKYNKASRFLSRYVKEYPSKYDLGETPITDFPNIEIIGIPSNIGQVKEAGHLLSEMIKKHEIADVENAIDTAVILPDEELFIPLIHSLPAEIKSVNITMGYPMRHTSVASLIKNIVSMQLRARVIKDELQFFYEDVQNVLSHPLIRSIATKECESLLNLMTERRMFNIPTSYIIEHYPSLQPIFFAVKNIKNAEEVFDYAFNLVHFIKKKISQLKSNSLEIGFLAQYLQAINQLKTLSKKYSIVMQEKTFFHLLERAVSSETVNFIGEPLKGLQIMGVLETRALDFNNVILLSMNERIFPRKHYTRSFIPDALRRGYGMSTVEFQESIYAYYFYRLLSRAKNVYLFYDARNTGIKSGEMSRYLYQLKYLYSRPSTKSSIGVYDIHSTEERVINVEKTPEIMSKLDMFRTHGSGKNLSASAINQYINCPLSFYLEKVEGLNIKDDVKEYMDESTYGTIVHEVAENVYKNLRGDADYAVIEEATLERLIHSEKMLSGYIRHSINEHYNKLGKNNDTPLVGEAKVLGDIILYFMKLLFKNEKQFAPFAFVDGEKKMKGCYRVTPDISINFTQTIDRIDRVGINEVDGGILRIVDYKTGSDSIKANSIEKIFDSSADHREKAILQLFLYCNFYAQETGYSDAIQPMLYALKSINIDHLKPLTIDRKILSDYRDYNEEFKQLLASVIEDMFNPLIPFSQAQSDDACKYCKFKGICGK